MYYNCKDFQTLMSQTTLNRRIQLETLGRATATTRMNQEVVYQCVCTPCHPPINIHALTLSRPVLFHYQFTFISVVFILPFIGNLKAKKHNLIIEMFMFTDNCFIYACTIIILKLIKLCSSNSNTRNSVSLNKP